MSLCFGRVILSIGRVKELSLFLKIYLNLPTQWISPQSQYEFSSHLTVWSPRLLLPRSLKPGRQVTVKLLPSRLLAGGVYWPDGNILMVGCSGAPQLITAISNISQAPTSFSVLTCHAGQVVNGFDLPEIIFITYAR